MNINDFEQRIQDYWFQTSLMFYIATNTLQVRQVWFIACVLNTCTVLW